MEKILIHTCCADCFLNTIGYLENEGIINNQTEITSFFYNPNIHPRSEYIERLNALKKILSKDIKLVVPDYRPTDYFKSIEGKKERCIGCWEVRLKRLFEYAKDNNIYNVTSTLLVSLYQERSKITDISKRLNREYGLNFVNIDSKHNCKHKGFYKQNFCGCCYSLLEKMTKKEINTRR